MESCKCPRGREDCAVIANIIADEMGSFICVGYNHKEDREAAQDRFTHCWKNDVTDERGHWDRRDLIDTIAVMSRALSTDENIRVTRGVTDDEMNEMDFR